MTLDDLKQLAIEAFSRHELIYTSYDQDRWRIARVERGEIKSTYATEIISLWGGRLYVGGDIDDCIFAYYSDSANPIDKLKWIGRNNDVGYYVCQKAQIGMTDNGKLTTEGRGKNKGPSARVVYAWAAVRRLCDLFDMEQTKRDEIIEKGRAKRAEIDEIIKKEREALTPKIYEQWEEL